MNDAAKGLINLYEDTIIYLRIGGDKRMIGVMGCVRAIMAITSSHGFGVLVVHLKTTPVASVQGISALQLHPGGKDAN